MIPELAVVIPAYKEAYFQQALQSLADQTCKSFNVYIGDDCSPDDLKTVAGNFSGVLNISYTRFSNNIGSRNLVNQWKRCIELARGEKWIWLFSDDDLADPRCVEHFYKISNSNKERFDVYRFNTCIINKEGGVISNTPVGPMEESSASMAYHLLKGQRGNSMPDHIFSRKVYDEQGGIVFTQYAQGADWATSILFSRKKGIAIIPGSKIYWRYSGLNISSGASGVRGEMVDGHFQFLNWVLDHFKYLKKSGSAITYEMIQASVRINIRNIFINHFKGATFKNYVHLFFFMRMKLKLSLKQAIADIHHIDVCTGDTLASVSDLKGFFTRMFSYRTRN